MLQRHASTTGLNVQSFKSSLARVMQWDILLFIACSLIFVLFPGVDLATSHYFYDAAKGDFIADQYIWMEWIYWFFAKIKFLLLPLLIALSIYFYRRLKNSDSSKKWLYTFLLCSMLLGPGVLVNIVLKDNSIGRARPIHVVDFGGDKTFTRAFEYSGQCPKNCSFVSGHAAMGFFFIGLGWLLNSRLAFLTGLGIGFVVGGTRIVQGGHFLSDVVLGFWAVYFVNMWLAHQFGLQSPRDILKGHALSNRLKKA